MDVVGLELGRAAGEITLPGGRGRLNSAGREAKEKSSFGVNTYFKSANIFQ